MGFNGSAWYGAYNHGLTKYFTNDNKIYTGNVIGV